MHRRNIGEASEVEWRIDLNDTQQKIIKLLSEDHQLSAVKLAKENNMEWFGIIALILLLYYSAYPGKVKRLETKVKRLEKKQRGVAYMSKLINDLVGKQCIIRSEFIFSFAGKTELSCKIIDADDEWIKICYTEKKDKQVVKLMRIENIESIEEQ